MCLSIDPNSETAKVKKALFGVLGTLGNTDSNSFKLVFWRSKKPMYDLVQSSKMSFVGKLLLELKTSAI